MLIIPELRVLVLTKRYVGSENKIGLERSWKWFFAASARAVYTAECIKTSTPEVECCVKSREPEIKFAGNICF